MSCSKNIKDISWIHHHLPKDHLPVGFTFASPSDDAQSTSEREREHPPLSSCRPVASPQRVCLREREGELLGCEAPLSKCYSCRHVHFLTSDEERYGLCPLPDSLSLSLCHRSLCLSCCSHVLLPFWRTSSPLRWAAPQTGAGSLKKKRGKIQIQHCACLFFPTGIENSLPSLTNSHELTG